MIYSFLDDVAGKNGPLILFADFIGDREGRFSLDRTLDEKSLFAFRFDSVEKDDQWDGMAGLDDHQFSPEKACYDFSFFLRFDLRAQFDRHVLNSGVAGVFDDQ